MKVLITGANGFVGRAIVSEVSRNNFQVFQLVNINSYSKNLENGTNIYKADISDYENLTAVVEEPGIDVFIHAAGLAHQFGKQNKEDFWKVNVRGTENAAKLAVSLKAAHFILISSVAVYGNQPIKSDESSEGRKEITEEAECNPQNFYARSKYESEKNAVRICEANGIALTILRLATVIGEDDKGNVARLINTIDKNRFVWIGNGENLKSLIFKDDVAKACLKVFGKTNGTEVFNVTGEAVSMKTVVGEIADRLGKNIPRLAISSRLLKRIFLLNSKTFKIKKLENFAATVEKWLSDDVFSGEKFKQGYGFQAETTISEAIKRQVEKFQKQK